MDGDEWIHLVVRFSERIRTRHRLAPKLTAHVASALLDSTWRDHV
jgi:hypothetical protein